MDGKTFAQYRVIERMGSGGMGTVYRAIDETLEREVAIKVIAPDVDDPERRFRAEAVAIARLHHPGIAAIYELFEQDGQWIMVMELVRGETLEQITDRIGPLSPKRAAEICMQALLALSHAHAKGVIHRDLKPANLMVAEDGVVKIMDFGIARVHGAEHLTGDGFMMGTPAYMSPEQVMGQELDGRADLYAMGVMFYRLITGKLPFKGDSPYDMAQAHLKDAPIPVDLVRPDVPLWVKYVLDLALAKARDQRFQSADDFHHALSRALADSPPTAARRLTRTDHVARPTITASGRIEYPHRTRRRRARLWTAAVASIVVATGAAGSVWLQQPVEPAVPSGAPSAGTTKSATPAKGGSQAGSMLTEVRLPVAVEPRKDAMPPSPTPSRGASPIVAAFNNLRMLVVDEGKSTDREVVLSFTNRDLSVVPPETASPVFRLPYTEIVKATYVRARNPRWDPALARPADKIDVSGLFSRAKHWLTIQSKTDYVILRVDSAWQRVLESYEVATGKRIDRPLFSR